MIQGIEMIEPAEAQNFYREGMKQLDQVIFNEQDAKHGLLLAMASPSEGPTGVVLLGGTGGGKTTLIDRSHLLIRGVESENVAEFPPQSDLRPLEIVGGRVETTVETEQRGVKSRETKIQRVSGLIHGGTKVIKINEIDTINPPSLNVVREVLASGTLTNTEGTITIPGLLFFASTRNPLDNKGKYEVSDAMASRHAIGVYVGHDDAKNVETVEKIFDGFQPIRAEDIQTVTDLDAIAAIRKYARLGIAFPETLMQDTAKRVVAASRALIGLRIDDTPQRLSVQVMDTAKAEAALQGEKHLKPENIEAALRFALMARVGLKGVARSKTPIPEIVDDILQKG